MIARYYSPDDPESYVTPSRLKRLRKDKQVEYIVHWFRGMFEDPQNETPYADKESPYNYEYIWGGPYDANSELSDEFGGIVSDEVIEAATKEVESEGIVEWAPGTNHPDQKSRHDDAIAEQFDAPPPSLDEIRQRLESGAQPNFGVPQERKDRQTLRNEIAQLRELIEAQTQQHGGIGHNNPPDEIALNADQATVLTRDIEAIDKELAKPSPDVTQVVGRISSVQRLMAWGANKLDLATDAFMKRLGDLAAVGVVGALGVKIFGSWQTVWITIKDVVEAAMVWLNTVTQFL